MPCEPQSAILVVDDSPNDVALLERAFERVGVQNPLAVCKGGAEAIQYLLSHELPCVMLLDLRMPATNGFDVLKRVKTDPRLKELIVIVLTTSGEVEDIRRAYELGANAYMVKPMDFKAVEHLFESITHYWGLECAKPELELV